jgi:general secretion pathway protein J
MIRADDQDGFTLVEMLVAIALLAMMFGYAYSAIHTFRFIKRAETVAAQQRAVDAAQRHLRLVVAGARASFTTTGTGETRLLFDGRASELTVASLLDDRIVQGGLRQLHYFVEPGSGRLVVSHGLKRDPDPQVERTDAVLNGVVALSFSYFGQPDPDQGPQWVSQWPRQDALPDLVRIEAEMADDVQAKWPAMTIAIEASR